METGVGLLLHVNDRSPIKEDVKQMSEPRNNFEYQFPAIRATLDSLQTQKKKLFTSL